MTGYVVCEMTFNWFEIEGCGLPAKADSDFYGGRYSVPVLVANETTEQVFDQLVVYDFDNNGWCYHGLPNGSTPDDYEMIHVTHYGYVPEFVNPGI